MPGEWRTVVPRAYADWASRAPTSSCFGTGDLTDDSVIDSAGDTGIGVITSGVYSAAHDSAANRQFVADYVSQFGKSPRTSSANIAVWDALRLIYDGIAAQGAAPFDADKFMAFVRGRSIESPRGPISIDKGNGDITQNVYIRRVERRDGVLQNVEIATVKDVSAK
jgi:branched-chain amino acid transport system substrate-binding protein